jgi:hypothetical protein
MLKQQYQLQKRIKKPQTKRTGTGRTSLVTQMSIEKRKKKESEENKEC